MIDNKSWFHSPKHVSFTHLHWMCLTTCRQEVQRQEIYQDDLPLIGCRLEICQDACLPLIGPDKKFNELRVFLLKTLQTIIWGSFPGNLEMGLARDHPPRQYLIKACFKFVFKLW